MSEVKLQTESFKDVHCVTELHRVHHITSGYLSQRANKLFIEMRRALVDEANAFCLVAMAGNESSHLCVYSTQSA